MRHQGNIGSLSLLFLRLVAGLAFYYHGYGKMISPFTWMGVDASIPGFLQFLAALAEFGGGIFWIAGLLMPVASIGLAVTMLVASSLHFFILGDPFVSMEGGSYELALIYLAVSLVFLTFGPGKFSLDRLIFGEK